MNIAVVTPWHVSPEAVGGTERFTIDLASGLSNLGHDVEVFTLSGKDAEINGIRHTSFDILGNGENASEYDLREYAGTADRLAFYERLAAFMESKTSLEQFDVVQLNSFLFASAWQEKPRLLTTHTNPFEYQLDWGEGASQTLEDVLASPAGQGLELVSPSKHYANIFSDMFSRHVQVIPHAIDRARLWCDDVRDSRTTNILIPSRLEPIQKRPQIVFEGVAALEPTLRDSITIVATGKDNQYINNEGPLRTIAQKHRIKAIFSRFATMAEAYAGADIVALPSVSESFGYSALEALSLGKPTILNSIPTFREIGAGNPNAHFFDGSVSSFTTVLRSLLENLIHWPVPDEWHARYSPIAWAQNYELLLQETIDART